MRTLATLVLAALACAGCPQGPPPAPVGPLPQGTPFTPVAPVAPVPPAGPERSDRSDFTLALPGQDWVVRFRWADGVHVTSDRLEQGATVRRLMSLGDRGRLTLSVLIAPAPEGVATSEELRDLEWQRLKLGNRFVMEGFETFGTGDVFGGAYRVPVLRGIAENRRDHHCWMLRDGTAIHAWVTKSHATEADLGRLLAWSNSMQCSEEPACAADRLMFARAALAEDAAGAVERALPHVDAALARWSDLTAPQKLQLVWAAAEGYLAMDRTAEAQAVSERLLREQPESAGAHYVRAQCLASAGHTAQSVAALGRAFATEGAAAALPDPSADGWFIALGDDPAFEGVVATRAAHIAAAAATAAAQKK